ncbi:histamine H2 receptor-like [Actinia tenebrosa]|uniref:Histamine H2 receptor-like n=1 Tax=Actinia tenebrosa TaxID=6105 RepID=A0A6P8J152_ACTTE|nr:histamine H2 receptor-like [Actinia tenebrosa]XP_031573611.1 histamine H2 receptor-like [Actinia tenebrosa]
MKDINDSSIFTNMSTLIANSSKDHDAATQALIEVYLKFELASVVFLVLLAAVTIPTNILLLMLIRMDPLKCFNKPTTPFIVGLAVADLLTGLTTEPFFAIYYYARHISPSRTVSPGVLLLYRAGQFASTVAISSSFLIVLALSWSQYIAVAFPHRYSTLITRKRVTVCVCGSWVYFFCFSLLQFAKIDLISFLKADLVLHPTLISAVLLITIILLYKSFQQEIQRKRSFAGRSKNDHENRARKEAENIERQFTIVTIYLAGILLASALPHMVIQYVFLYGTFSVRGHMYLSICLRVRDLLLFLKVALDAFIYAWRLKTYRQTFQHTVKCCVFKRKDNGGNSLII